MNRGKVFLICGKICSGKSYYAEKLLREKNAVILSVDEVSFALFDGELGEKHDDMTERIKKYLYKKSIDILKTGTNVILEWGFWKKAWRKAAIEFYKSHGFEYEFHYVDISDSDWEKNICERNKKVQDSKTNEYYLDEGLKQKLEVLFEKPDKSEIDVWHWNKR